MYYIANYFLFVALAFMAITYGIDIDSPFRPLIFVIRMTQYAVILFCVSATIFFAKINVVNALKVTLLNRKALIILVVFLGGGVWNLIIPAGNAVDSAYYFVDIVVAYLLFLVMINRKAQSVLCVNALIWLNVLAIVAQHIVHWYSNQVWNIHSSIMPFSREANLEAYSFIRLSGYQEEPGYYAIFIIFLLLISWLLNHKKLALVHHVGLISIAFTLSLAGMALMLLTYILFIIASTNIYLLQRAIILTTLVVVPVSAGWIDYITNVKEDHQLRSDYQHGSGLRTIASKQFFIEYLGSISFSKLIVGHGIGYETHSEIFDYSSYKISSIFRIKDNGAFLNTVYSLGALYAGIFFICVFINLPWGFWLSLFFMCIIFSSKIAFLFQIYWLVLLMFTMPPDLFARRQQREPQIEIREKSPKFS